MCGLVGVAARTVTDQLKNAFNDMLYLDVLRGEDSTGVAAISNAHLPNPEVELFKEVGSAAELFYLHAKGGRNKSLTFKPVSIYLGHNRAATQGKVNSENAHPFEFDNVVGAHNGTLQMSSLTTFHGYKDFEVDSQILYSHLSHTQNIDEVWAKAEGAMALVYWDKANRKLNMIRNSQRPLWVAYSEDDKQVLWASESWMIYIACSRRGIKIKEPFEIQVNTLYTFTTLDTPGVDFGKVRHVERAVAPFVPKPVVPYQYPFRGRNGNGYEGSIWDNWFPNDDDGKEPNLAGVNNTNTVSAKKTVVEQTSEDHYLIIKEFHRITPFPRAIGYTQSGREVMINISANLAERAEKEITGRGQSGFYHSTIKLRKSLALPGTFWCNYSDLRFMKPKQKAFIKEGADNSWRLLEKKEEKSEEMKEYAPWFAPDKFLNRKGFEEKVEAACGCSSCSEHAKWEDRDKTVWIGDIYYFCKNCTSLGWVQDAIKMSNENQDAA